MGLHASRSQARGATLAFFCVPQHKVYLETKVCGTRIARMGLRNIDRGRKMAAGRNSGSNYECVLNSGVTGTD